MRIRVVPTASGAVAVQVVRYTHHHTAVIKHVGSGRTKEDVALLKCVAREWIEQQSRQEQLFSSTGEREADQLLLKTYRYRGFRYGLLAETVRTVFALFGMTELSFPSCSLFGELVLARITEPSSKRQSQQTLSRLFGITRSLTDIYRALPEIAAAQEVIEKRLTTFAQVHLGFDFRFVLYDMTTLYFETFTQDALRKPGFSKDNKVGQPQIMVGLVVTREGFPINVSLFEGNTFEGHTLLPVLLAFKRTHAIGTLTVVADAAMISHQNIRALEEANLSYIVGARLGALPIPILRDISRRLNRKDSAWCTIPTKLGRLICHFSSRRYAKDKHEMDRQTEKAREIVEGKREAVRNKFIVKPAGAPYALNQTLLYKATLMLGVKGYYTNLAIPERLVIERYADLWHIEQAFRISKHDLEARPVYHVKREAITAHLLICVAALAVVKWLEIKSGCSAAHVVSQLKSVTDARLMNTITGKETLLRSEIPDELASMLKKLAPH